MRAPARHLDRSRLNARQNTPQAKRSPRCWLMYLCCSARQPPPDGRFMAFYAGLATGSCVSVALGSRQRLRGARDAGSRRVVVANSASC